MSNEIPYLEQLRQAVAASGEPDTATISRLVDAVFAQPDVPPEDERLWPIHGFVRACVQMGMFYKKRFYEFPISRELMVG